MGVNGYSIGVIVEGSTEKTPSVSSVNISSISAHATAPVVTTSSSHGFSDGDLITITGNDALLELVASGGGAFGSAGVAKNIAGTYTISNASGSTFTISGNTTGVGSAGGAYGKASKVTPSFAATDDLLVSVSGTTQKDEWSDVLPIINMQTYGVLPGGTDCAPGLQRLFDDVMRLSSDDRVKGAKIYGPEGQYYLAAGVQYCPDSTTGAFRSLSFEGVGVVDYHEAGTNRQGTLFYFDSSSIPLTIPNLGRSARLGTITANSTYTSMFYIGRPQNDTALAHYGPKIDGICFHGDVTDNSEKLTLLRINGLNRWRIEGCSFRGAWRGYWVDDHVNGIDCDWGHGIANFFNDVNTSIASYAGHHVIGGAINCDNTAKSSTGVNFTAWSGTTEKADFEWTTANTLYEKGDIVTFSGTGDSDLDGHFFAIQYTSSTTGSIYIRKDVTSVSSGTIGFCNTAIVGKSSNIKVTGARFGVGGTPGYTVGFGTDDGGAQIVGNGFEGHDCAIVIDGLGSSAVADNSSIAGNRFNAHDIGITLGFFTTGNSHAGNGFEGVTTNVVDRGTQAIDGIRLNFGCDQEFSAVDLLGLPEPTTGAPTSQSNFPTVMCKRAGSSNKRWEMRWSTPSASQQRVLATEGSFIGQATITNGNSSVAVSFATSHTDANYYVVSLVPYFSGATAADGVTFSASEITSSGFNIRSSSSVTKDTVITWVIERLIT